MVFMAETVDGVQPDEGQGGTAGDSPFQEYLDRIPEEGREAALEAFRDFDANTTKKFQAASEYRKGWEPFEQLGVNHRDPEEVAWAMQMLDAVQGNPQAVSEWFQTYAQEHGLTPAQAEQMAEEAYVDPSVSQLVQQQLQAQLGPVASQLQELAEWRDSQAQEAQEAHIQSEIRSELDTLKAKHPDDYSEAMVEKFIANHLNDATDAREAVQAAFSDWQTIKSQIEKDTLNGKASTPAGAESGGVAHTQADQATTFKEAGIQAAEMIREMNRNR